MCFSAAGSFSLAGVLTTIGAVSIVRNTSAQRRMFAAIPLLFAAQQAAEGTVWVTVAAPAHTLLNRLAVNVFLGLAVLVWPLWLPLALERMEPDARRKRVLRWLCWCGAAVATGALVLLVRWRPTAAITGHSITYAYALSDDTARSVLSLSAYVLPTVVPFFVSTTKMSRLIGVTLVVSLAAAVIVENAALTSVWCFFAAIISTLIVIAVHGNEHQPERTEMRPHCADTSSANA